MAVGLEYPPVRAIRLTRMAVGAAAAVLAVAHLSPATALAEPNPQPAVENPGPEPELLHNVIYRARVDGVSRGATITYRAEGDQLQTASPTMVPGRVFEVNTVLPASDVANLRVSIEWPYSANLHCEILVDDALVAQADDFIGPRVLPQRDDPDFGALTCEAPVSGVVNSTPGQAADPPSAGQLPQPVDTALSPT